MLCQVPSNTFTSVVYYHSSSFQVYIELFHFPTMRMCKIQGCQVLEIEMRDKQEKGRIMGVGGRHTLGGCKRSVSFLPEVPIALS